MSERDSSRTSELVPKAADSPEEQESPKAARRRNPEESKRRILDAAEGAFARRGFDGSRLRDIAQLAGVHHALVHHYYGDKRGLFAAVLRRGLGSMAAIGLADFNLADGLQAGVETTVGALFDFLTDNRDLLRIIEGAFRDKHSASFEVATAALGVETQPLLARIGDALGRGQELGLVRSDIPAETCLLYCFSLVVYPFMMGSGLSGALGIPRYATEHSEADRRHLVALILQALRPGQ